MTANPTLLHRKYAHVIYTISTEYSLDLNTAMELFYKSQTYDEMRLGIADMHCRSEKYLAEEVMLELENKV